MTFICYLYLFGLQIKNLRMYKGTIPSYKFWSKEIRGALIVEKDNWQMTTSTDLKFNSLIQIDTPSNNVDSLMHLTVHIQKPQLPLVMDAAHKNLPPQTRWHTFDNSCSHTVLDWQYVCSMHVGMLVCPDVGSLIIGCFVNKTYMA